MNPDDVKCEFANQTLFESIDLMNAGMIFITSNWLLIAWRDLVRLVQSIFLLGCFTVEAEN